MRQLLLFVIINLFSLSVIAADDYQIPLDSKFTEDAVLEERKIAPSKLGLATEKGVINGIPYSIEHHFGIARFAGTPGNSLEITEHLNSNWEVICGKDEITDERSCHIIRGNLSINMRMEGVKLISVMGKEIPEIASSAFIRLDSNPAFETRDIYGRFNAKDVEAIFSQLKTANKISLRFKQWPSEISTTQVLDSQGFREVLQYVEWVQRQIK